MWDYDIEFTFPRNQTFEKEMTLDVVNVCSMDYLDLELKPVFSNEERRLESEEYALVYRIGADV